jgi:hypothetical protein
MDIPSRTPNAVQSVTSSLSVSLQLVQIATNDSVAKSNRQRLEVDDGTGKA